MRFYTLRFGKYIGEHPVYNDNTEAFDNLNNGHANFLRDFQTPVTINFKLWTDPDVKAGEWIRSDDGRIVQCLNRYDFFKIAKRLGNKKLPTTVSIKTVFGVFSYYHKAKGGLAIYKKMLADPKTMGDVTFNRVSITNQCTIAGKFLTKKKRLFAYYVVVTGNPVASFAKINKNKRITKNIYKNAFALLKDPYVLAEIKTYTTMDDALARIQKAFADKNLDAERIAEEFDDGLKAVKKGTMAHAKWTELLRDTWSKIENVQIAGNTPSAKELVIDNRPPLAELPAPDKKIVDSVDANFIESKKLDSD